MDITSAGHGTLLKVTMPLPRLDPAQGHDYWTAQPEYFVRPFDGRVGE
jgi:hypothetical protein